MILETQNLNISKFQISDSPFILELLNTPSWLKYIGDKNVKNLGDAHQYLLNGPIKSYEENDFGLWKVTLKEGDISIGMCGLVNRPTLEDVDIGFAMLPEFSGKGYGFESASATLAFAKNELNLKKIVAITMEENVYSQKLLQKIGLRFEQNVKFSEEGEELMLFGIDF